MKFRLRDYFFNPVTVGGVILAVLCFGACTVLLILDFYEEHANPYRGVLTFFLFPALMIFSLFISGFGMVIEARRRKRLKDLPARAVNRTLTRGRFFGYTMLSVALVFMLLSSVGGYKAYEFTDSVQFCGKLCHEVMEPEYVTYLNSPHARVKCVECHVGPGAEWYVKAKFSGLYQIYATVLDEFPRPIPTPISSLRPAQETCEKCHWPKKFWGAQLATRVHYGFDFGNTRREILMLVKTGGGGSDHALSEGIHWHMNIGNHVEYIARDAKRLDIPWFKVVRPDGSTTEYRDSRAPPTSEELATLPRRSMDCMDCHNRPTHIYLSPERMVDRLLSLKKIDAGIHHLKEEAVAAVSRKFSSLEEALKGIEEGLVAAFKEKYPDVARAHEKGILTAAAELKSIYQIYFFPEMKADWSVYPDHIGHLEFPGCFRCHSGHHKSREGKTLSKNCDLCHDFVSRHTDRVSMIQVPSDASFVHPWRSGHDEMQCWECHTGKSNPYRTCAECHDKEEDAPMQFACTVCHQPMSTSKATASAGCIRCHSLEDSEFHMNKGHRNCTDCHEAHAWEEVDIPSNCRSCHEKFMKGHHEKEKCTTCHEFDGVESTLVSGPGK